jgi:hypothetical protein
MLRKQKARTAERSDCTTRVIVPRIPINFQTFDDMLDAAIEQHRGPKGQYALWILNAAADLLSLVSVRFQGPAVSDGFSGATQTEFICINEVTLCLLALGCLFHWGRRSGLLQFRHNSDQRTTVGSAKAEWLATKTSTRQIRSQLSSSERASKCK